MKLGAEIVIMRPLKNLLPFQMELMGYSNLNIFSNERDFTFTFF
jgi:hypothetical protein